MPTSKQSQVEAAILIPVYRGEDGAVRLVLVRRSQGGHHGGQLAFPGGKRDPHDQSLQQTALRETWEETGLTPESVDILASFPAVPTLTTGFQVHPFLGRIIAPPQWRRDEREIAEIIEVRLDDLARPEAHGEEIKQFPTWPAPERVPFYRVGPYQIWGATYRIFHPLLPRLLADEWVI
ncbi:MAG: CoA pyrophosphatase [Anaerolineaceae bacterium]|nr:CoA pyrophosphatase [Anaerolineaceae bacterium]MCB9101886.1 CoA pyrophosphatase [Anaerolineales bacterium]